MRKLLMIVCVAGLLAAQNPAAQESGSEKPIIVTTHTVLVPVTVVDRGGNSVPGLTPYDFRVLDNGKAQQITEDMAQHPLSVVVVIQANSDVEKILPNIMKQASALESLIVGADGEIAVMCFDHRIQTLTGFTSDDVQIDLAFRKLKPGSYTAMLNNATLAGIDLLNTRPPERRRVLLLISENRDKGSDISARKVLTEAELKNVIIYSMNVSELLAALTGTPLPNRPDNRPPGAVFLGGGNTNTPTTESQMNMGNWVPALRDIFDAGKGVFVKDPLDVYTRYSGGRECAFKTDKALAKCVEQIGNELHGQYLLSYVPNNMSEGGFHHIVVQVAKPGYEVRTREGYWIAAKPE